jgi:hypothetical protein
VSWCHNTLVCTHTCLCGASAVLWCAYRREAAGELAARKCVVYMLASLLLEPSNLSNMQLLTLASCLVLPQLPHRHYRLCGQPRHQAR